MIDPIRSPFTNGQEIQNTSTDANKLLSQYRLLMTKYYCVFDLPKSARGKLLMTQN